MRGRSATAACVSEQHPHHIFLAGGGGDDERRDRTLSHLCAVAPRSHLHTGMKGVREVARCHVRASSRTARAHQSGDDVGAAHFGRHMARAHASAVGDRRVSARFYQLLDDFDAALARRRHQRRQPIVPVAGEVESGLSSEGCERRRSPCPRRVPVRTSRR